MPESVSAKWQPECWLLEVVLPTPQYGLLMVIRNVGGIPRLKNSVLKSPNLNDDYLGLVGICS